MAEWKMDSSAGQFLLANIPLLHCRVTVKVRRGNVRGTVQGKTVHLTFCHIFVGRI